jgi:sugar/nucleoside kinase (ribokinase family)
MPTIVAIGEALVEIMRPGRDQPLDQPGAFFGPYPSGAPAILASAAARLGASVGFVGTVGDDPFGRSVRARLLADGIDCAALRVTSERLTGIAFVAYRRDGSRSFVFHLAQSAAALVDTDQLPAGYLDETRFLHIMGSSLTLSEGMRRACYQAAATVHAHGGVVSLDPNLRPELMLAHQIRSICEPVLHVANLVFPSGPELTTLTGAGTAEEGARQLLDTGVGLVALKQGEQGSTLYTAQGAKRLEAYRVTEVDPTGAGDCYDAAFLVGLAEEWPTEVAGLFANAAGALATTRLGPMEGAFTRGEVLAFMAAQGRPLPFGRL